MIWLEGNWVIEIEGEVVWLYLMSKFDFLVDIYFGLCILVVGMVELLFEDFWEFYDNNYILWVIVKVDEDGSFYMLVDCF